VAFSEESFTPMSFFVFSLRVCSISQRGEFTCQRGRNGFGQLRRPQMARSTASRAPSAELWRWKLNGFSSSNGKEESSGCTVETVARRTTFS
jgi:hypothetical protein